MALLNLDAAVVLLTPLYIRTAVLVDVDPVALAFQPVLLASLASGVLVVSNLTNLLAASQLSLHERRLPPAPRVAVGGGLGGRLVRVPPRVPGSARAPWRRAPTALDRRALVVGLGAIALFLVLLLGGEPFGLPAWAAALATEVALIGVTRQVPWRHVPVGTAVLAGRARGARGRGRGARCPHVFTSLGAGGVQGLRRRCRVGQRA